MGIMSAISTDVKELVDGGFDDTYISLSVGIDLSIIKPLIEYFRKEKERETKRLNNK